MAENTQSAAVGSIVLKRMHNGDSLQMTINVTGGLYQLVDDMGRITPDWSDNNNDSNRPVLTPKITSLRGENVSIVSGKWLLDDTEISNGADWSIDSNYALKPLNNVASAAHIYNRILTFKAKCQIENKPNTEEIVLSKEIEIRKGSESAYWAHIATDNGNVLDKTNASTTLTASLSLGSNIINEFEVKWYKSTPDGTANNDLLLGEEKTLKVTRADVDTVATFIAKCFINKKLVEAASITVYDEADTLKMSFSGNYTDIKKKEDVIVKTQIYDVAAKNGSALPVASWSATVREPEGLAEKTEGWSMDKEDSTTGIFTMNEADMVFDYKGDIGKIEIEPIVEIQGTLA